MAPSLASLLAPHSTFHPFPSTTKTPNLPSQSRTLILRYCTEQKDSLSNPIPKPNSWRKSFAVATGEIFLGITSRLLGKGSFAPVERSDDIDVSGVRYDDERIEVVIEDEIEPEVIWEQRLKDVEAEKERQVVTSPGFSFSAAGLVFPYHLGVAQFLLKKGYIKETTPLAGASAGAIVCAVVASGASMQEALEATKILAEDCRLRGTAFRLGAVLRDVLNQFLPDDVHTNCAGIQIALGYLDAAADDVLDRLFELGYLDAAVWAEENPVEELVSVDGTSLVKSSTS